MTKEEFENLKAGDVVRHKNDGQGFIVHANYLRYVIAVRTQHMSNPDEWDLVSKAIRKDD